MTHHQVYGLDIETNGSLDPRRGAVRTVALSLAGRNEMFTGDEPALLTELDQYLRALPSGLLATWNGGAFDLPFLADRASILGMSLGLTLAADPRLRVAGQPLPGHSGAYRGAWYQHRHIDASRLYRASRSPLGEVAGLLSSIARGPQDSRPGFGLPINADLDHEIQHALPASDAKLARVLVQRRISHVSRHVDRIVRPGDSTVAEHGLAWRSPARPPLSPSHPAVRAMLAGRA